MSRWKVCRFYREQETAGHTRWEPQRRKQGVWVQVWGGCGSQGQMAMTFSVRLEVPLLRMKFEMEENKGARKYRKCVFDLHKSSSLLLMY